MYEYSGHSNAAARWYPKEEMSPEALSYVYVSWTEEWVALSLVPNQPAQNCPCNPGKWFGLFAEICKLDVSYFTINIYNQSAPPENGATS